MLHTSPHGSSHMLCRCCCAGAHVECHPSNRRPHPVGHCWHTPCHKHKLYPCPPNFCRHQTTQMQIEMQVAAGHVCNLLLQLIKCWGGRSCATLVSTTLLTEAVETRGHKSTTHAALLLQAPIHHHCSLQYPSRSSDAALTHQPWWYAGRYCDN